MHFNPDKRLRFPISRRLKYCEPSELPIRISKGSRVGSNEFGAGSRASALLRKVLRLASELTAQIDVRDDRLISKMGADIAVGGREVGQWCTPGRWVRRRCERTTGCGGERGAREEPDSDAGTAEFHCVNTTFIGIQGRPKGITGALHTAALIAVCTIVTIRVQHFACLFPLDAHAASISGMQGHLVA